MHNNLLQKIRLIGLSLGISLPFAASPVLAQAQDAGGGGGGGGSTGIAELDGVSLSDAQGTFGFDSLSAAVNTLVTVIFFVAGLAAFLFILWGAVSYIMAGDDASKLEAARKKITNAVVGLILVALVYVIWLIAAQIFGIDTLLN